jgi:hypothetical protein
MSARELASEAHPRTPSPFERTDYWRRSPAAQGGRPGHKEWTYFCVFGHNLEVLVNFSLMDRLGERTRALDVARIALLVCEDGRWDGDVEEFRADDVVARSGSVAARFGRNVLGFSEGAYHLDVDLPRRNLRVALQARPSVAPAIASSVRLSAQGAMRWLVVPRLVASGVVQIGNRRHALGASLAYHDRNWGYFDWGGDFAWEWAAVLPEDGEVPWSLVYMRITDRARNRALSQSVIVWRNERPWKTFHGRDVEVGEHGLRWQAQVLRVPRVMHLAAPGSAADAPASVSLRALSGRDVLEAELTFGNMAQIGIPNDRASGVTLLSETSGRAHVVGRLRGEPVDYQGRVLAERNHGA